MRMKRIGDANSGSLGIVVSDGIFDLFVEFDIKSQAFQIGHQDIE